MDIKTLVYCKSNDIPLKWNDPLPIKGNNYTITNIGELNEDFDEDTPILIQYGEGSEAEVFCSEIEII